MSSSDKQQRIAQIYQEFDYLNEQVDDLKIHLDDAPHDPVVTKLRLDDLSVALKNYSRYHTELRSIDPEDEKLIEFRVLKSVYYKLAATVSKSQVFEPNANSTLN